jgi:hypothetical protein
MVMLVKVKHQTYLCSELFIKWYQLVQVLHAKKVHVYLLKPYVLFQHRCLESHMNGWAACLIWIVFLQRFEDQWWAACWFWIVFLQRFVDEWWAACWFWIVFLQRFEAWFWTQVNSVVCPLCINNKL